MDYLEKLFPPKIIYYISVSNEWDLLCMSVDYNLCILDTTSKIGLVTLHQNRLTGRVNGFYIKNYTDIAINNIIRRFTWNVPIYVILIEKEIKTIEVIEKEKHKTMQIINYSIQQDTYIKTDYKKTYLTTATEIFHPCSTLEKIITNHVAKDLLQIQI